MIKNLVIVESPAKAKTIEGFLGKEYLVKSSYGHVRDLSKSKLGVDVESDFTPNYEITSDKKPIVNELKKLSKEAETVWLATDEDREGEAISWHLTESLKLDETKYKRIVFHEITPNAIKEAIETPRKINNNLVNAQQARRILDRLVGFELSPLLWKKVKPSLSAGRVQSVAVRLIVEREREIQNFKPEASYRVYAYFQVDNKGQKNTLRAELPKRFKTKKEALEFLESCKEAEYTVEKTETKPSKKSPAAPFTTSTLQQEASRKLGFSVARTMTVAQRLYESGRITYMRTDSVNLSNSAIGAAKEIITENYGEKYVKTRKYETKSKGAQEAHEAIRPTYINVTNIKGSQEEQKLYDLIRKRTIASQMSDALLEKTNVTIAISTSDYKFQASGEVLKFEGFLKVYIESKEEDEEEVETGILPPLKTSDKLHLNEINAIERFSKHPPRYAEASLVKKLEDLGIGRPSTYAPIISTIQKREYVLKESREGVKRDFNFLILKDNKIQETKKAENTGVEKNKLFPTDIGFVVTKFLVEYFDDILDYNFTANIEKKFDEVAQGQIKWNKVIHDFYWPFHNKVEETTEKSEKFSGERLLGLDPQTGRNIYAKIGRYGPMIQIGDAEEEEKPKFASILKNQSLETITLQEALDLFKLPRKVGSFEDKEIIASVGRFGPYVKFDNKFFSMPKQDDPLSINQERAIEIIKEKREAEKKKIIKSFDKDPETKVLKGRWGPYLSYKGKNYKIPKDINPEEITYEKCIELTKQATSDKKPRTNTKRKQATKKTKK